MALWLLFLSSFSSATILPGSSEVLLTALLVEGAWQLWELWGSATLGNVLGSLVTFYMGYFIHAKRPLKLSQNERYQRVHQLIIRWGWGSLLLSWLPVFGDIICLVAGWLRLNPWLSFIAILIGKGIRYGILIALVDSLS